MIGSGMIWGELLCLALVSLYGDSARHQLEPQRACRAAHAIVAARRPELGITPAVLAAIAINESNLDPSRVNVRSGTCGAMQVSRPPEGCAVVTSSHLASYQAGVARLVAWQGTCKRLRRPTLRCALDGYRGGTAAARTGGSGGVVLRRAALIQRAMALDRNRLPAPRKQPTTRNVATRGAGFEIQPAPAAHVNARRSPPMIRCIDQEKS